MTSEDTIILKRFGWRLVKWVLIIICVFMASEFIHDFTGLQTDNYAWYFLGAFNVIYWKLHR